MKKHHWKRITVLLLVLAVLISCPLYLTSYYPAGEQAEEALHSTANVKVTEEGKLTIFDPGDTELGLIFYPGGKVEETAYAPLLHQLADRGIFCVLVRMPLHLAIFDVNAADGITENFPQIKTWYIGGHSLGGAAAAMYTSEHPGVFTGVILLGAYSTKDLQPQNLKVLLVYGTEDGVMNRENYEQGKKNLPENTTEYVIEGGCHAFFGDYGAQKGDGTPSITMQEQIHETVEVILQRIAE